MGKVTLWLHERRRAQRSLAVPAATDLGPFEVPIICAGAVWLLRGTDRVIEVGGCVFPDDKSPLANCHIK